MKRVVKTFLIIAAILIVIGMALAAASLFFGAHISDIWNGNLPVTEFEINNNTVGFSFGADNNAPYSKENTYSVSAEGINAVQIDWVSGEVTVKIGETDQILFSEAGADLTEKTALRYIVQGNTLEIHYGKEQSFFHIDLPAKQLTVILPATLAANLQFLSVETVSADAIIDDPLFRMEKLNFGTVSGNLNAVFDSTGKMSAETVSGNISISGAVNDFEAGSVSGNVSVSGAISKFEAESDSGDVLLDCRNGAPIELDVDTTSGNVVLHLPKDANLTLDYETVSGDFDSTFAMSIRNGNYVIGAGRSKWVVETVSGDLTVK